MNDIDREDFLKGVRVGAKTLTIRTIKCYLCGVEKPISQFGKNKLIEKTGVLVSCLECRDKTKSPYMSKANVTAKTQLMIMLGNLHCVKCGFADIRALQIDHKFGGGGHDLKKRGGGIGLYTYYLNNPVEAKAKLQVLCANCNWVKRHTDREFHGSNK